MLQIILYQPEIPPNTGNIIRLCANVGARLHLVKPLGFRLDAAKLRRAGMDYAEIADVRVHETWLSCLEELGECRIFALTTRARVRHDEPRYQATDAFLFGSETSGLPAELLADFAPERRIRVPMVPGNRSINLSNTVAVVAFEAWRQLGYANGA